MTYYYETELYHHGIKGQQWGVRRFQNEDGTLTPAGMDRYYKLQSKKAAALSLASPTVRAYRDSGKVTNKIVKVSGKATDLALNNVKKSLVSTTKAGVKLAKNTDKTIFRATRFIAKTAMFPLATLMPGPILKMRVMSGMRSVDKYLAKLNRKDQSVLNDTRKSLTRKINDDYNKARDINKNLNKDVRKKIKRATFIA